MSTRRPSGRPPRPHGPRDPWDHPDARRWRERANRELRPMIADSAASITLWPNDGEPDAKIAVELGFTLLLGKPLILLVPNGSTAVPEHLASLAQAIIEYDSLDDPTLGDRIAAELARITGDGQ